MVRFSRSQDTSYAILASGELVAWGSDEEGQGESGIPDLLFPEYGEVWVQVTGGYNHAIALSNLGLVYRWGGEVFQSVSAIPEFTTCSDPTPSAIQSYVTKLATGHSAGAFHYVIIDVPASPPP